MCAFDLTKEKTMTKFNDSTVCDPAKGKAVADEELIVVEKKVKTVAEEELIDVEKKEKTVTEEELIDVEKKGKTVADEELIVVEKKVKEAFDDDHSDLAADVYTQSKAPKYVELFEGKSCANYSTVGSSRSIQARGETTDLATKGKEDGVLKIAKKAAVVVGVGVAGVAVVGWGIYKLLGNKGLSGHSKDLEGDLDSKSDRKMMKAPERPYSIYRDDFERDPKSYFKELRNSKKGRKPF